MKYKRVKYSMKSKARVIIRSTAVLRGLIYGKLKEVYYCGMAVVRPGCDLTALRLWGQCCSEWANLEAQSRSSLE